MENRRRARNICIVGNIASGKSTLTQLLAERVPASCAVSEEFTQNAFLPLYLREPARWAFMNALRYYYDYARAYQEATAGCACDLIFIDAGGASNRLVYGRYLLSEQVITPDEHSFYELLCDLIQKQFEYPEPDAYIYLKVSPETCYERMVQRGWAMQRPVSLDYLRALVDHFDALAEMAAQQGIPTLVLEGQELDLITPDGQARVTRQVQEFLGRAS